METYTATIIPRERSVQLVLHPQRGEQFWEAMEQYFNEQMGKGLIYWDIDLRQLTMLNSMLLGLLVGMNSQVTSHGGQLRLIVPEKSGVNQVLTLSRMRRILQVITV